MTIEIPSEFESFIEHAVASGRYRSEAEFFADRLRLLRDHDRKWDALRDEFARPRENKLDESSCFHTRRHQDLAVPQPFVRLRV